MLGAVVVVYSDVEGVDAQHARGTIGVSGCVVLTVTLCTGDLSLFLTAVRTAFRRFEKGVGPEAKQKLAAADDEIIFAAFR